MIARPAIPRPAGWLAACLLAMLLALPGLAVAAQAHLEMDRGELRVGETASLRLVCVGGAPERLPSLQAPEQVRLAYQGPYRETVSVNFRTTRVLTHTWAVTALRPGRILLGPVEMDVKGQRLRTNAVELRVLEPLQDEGGSTRLWARVEPAPEGLGQDEPVPLWQGQALVYRFGFEHSEPVYNASWSQPEFDGLVAAPGVDQSQREYALQRDGARWTVNQIDVGLVASTPGLLEIPPSVISAQFPAERQQRRRRDPFEDFFGGSLMPQTRSEVLSSGPVTLSIEPLPVQGRPAAFSGLVGSFRAEPRLGASQLRVGESVTLTVVLQGEGSLAGFKLPPMGEQPGFRAYDDEPEITAELRDGRLLGRAVLRRALVPTAEGSLVVPPLELSWFDPQQGSYILYELPPLALQVQPGEAGASELASFADERPAGDGQVAALGADILPIHADVKVKDRRFHPGRPLPLLLLLLPGLALGGQVALDLRVRGGRRSRRLRAVRRRLESLPADRSERLAELDSAFREAAGLALGIPAAGVDPARLRAGLPEPLAAQAAALYARLEGARFGGSADAELEQVVRELVRRLLGRAR